MDTTADQRSGEEAATRTRTDDWLTRHRDHGDLTIEDLGGAWYALTCQCGGKLARTKTTDVVPALEDALLAACRLPTHLDALAGYDPALWENMPAEFRDELQRRMRGAA